MDFEFIKYLNDGEECKEIQGHRGYFITTMGRVYSTRSKKFLKDQKCNSYHRFVGIYISPGKNKSYNVSTLVGRHFLQDYREGLNILHIDETLPLSHLNRLENLRVGTQRDNMIDKFKKGRSKLMKLTPIDKHIIRLVKPSYSYTQLGDMYGVDRITIYRTCKETIS